MFVNIRYLLRNLSYLNRIIHYLLKFFLKSEKKPDPDLFMYDVDRSVYCL